MRTILIFDTHSSKHLTAPEGNERSPLETYIVHHKLREKFHLLLLDSQMDQYSDLMIEEKYDEAFKQIAKVSFSALEDARKKDSVVCLMLSDPNSLGAALVCHFLMSSTRSSAASSGAKGQKLKEYSAQKAIDLVKSRRLQTNILRQ